MASEGIGDSNQALKEQKFWFQIAAFLAFISFSMVMVFVVEIRSSQKELSIDVNHIKEGQASLNARVVNIERVVYNK